MNKKQQQRNSGFSLIEMLIYVSVLSVIAVLIVGAILPLSESYTRLQVSRTLTHSGETVLERIARAVRNAETVDTSASTFGSTPGELVVDSTATTTRFYVDNERIKVDENGAYAGVLTAEDVDVLSFVVEHADNGRTDGIHVQFELEGSEGSIVRQEMFYGGTVLRGAY